MLGEAEISFIDPGSQALELLAIEAREQGYDFMDRLIAEAISGANVFDRPGECFCGAFVEGGLVGCGGLNIDPYTQERAGRLRHVFVAKHYRKNGIGRLLIMRLLDLGTPAFKIVRLRTADQSANHFYEALGFRRIDQDFATHLIELPRASE